MAAPIGYQFPVFGRCLQVSLPCKVQVCQYNGAQCICTRDLGCIESEAVQTAVCAKTPWRRKERCRRRQYAVLAVGVRVWALKADIEWGRQSGCKIGMSSFYRCLVMVATILAGAARAGPAPFDLAGPVIEV